MKEFCEIFKALRKEKGLTQDQIAEVLGTSPQTISRWETGTSCPDITMLPAIASYFDITTDELLGIKKPVKKQKYCIFNFASKKVLTW